MNPMKNGNQNKDFELFFHHFVLYFRWKFDIEILLNERNTAKHEMKQNEKSVECSSARNESETMKKCNRELRCFVFMFVSKVDDGLSRYFIDRNEQLSNGSHARTAVLLFLLSFETWTTIFSCTHLLKIGLSWRGEGLGNGRRFELG